MLLFFQRSLSRDIQTCWTQYFDWCATVILWELDCTWRHGGHVGGQEQKSVSPLGTKLHEVRTRLWVWPYKACNTDRVLRQRSGLSSRTCITAHWLHEVRTRLWVWPLEKWSGEKGWGTFVLHDYFLSTACAGFCFAGSWIFFLCLLCTNFYLILAPTRPLPHHFSNGPTLITTKQITRMQTTTNDTGTNRSLLRSRRWWGEGVLREEPKRRLVPVAAKRITTKVIFTPDWWKKRPAYANWFMSINYRTAEFSR